LGGIAFDLFWGDGEGGGGGDAFDFFVGDELIESGLESGPAGVEFFWGGGIDEEDEGFRGDGHFALDGAESVAGATFFGFEGTRIGIEAELTDGRESERG